MKKHDFISGIIFILLGALFINPSIKLGIPSATSDGVPGAGFFPFVLALILILFGVAILFSSILKKSSEGSLAVSNINKENLKVLINTILSIIVFLILWKLASFIIATVCLSLFLNWYYKRSLKFNILFTVVFVALIHVVFTTLLRIQFVI